MSVIGTYVRGSSSNGQCVAALDTSGPADLLEFGKQSSTSCTVPLATLPDFEAFCLSTTARAEKEIFAQFLDRFQFVSIFGNPNINFSKDWVATIREEATDKLKEAGTMDGNACTIYAGLEIEILTSQVGFRDHM